MMHLRPFVAHRRLLRAVAAATCATLLVSCGGSSTASNQTTPNTQTAPSTPPTPSTYRVSASVSGLSGTGLVLQINTGGTLQVPTNGTITFPTPLATGTSYQVTVQSPPTSPQQACTVADGSGTIGAADVMINVTCQTVVVTTLYSFTGNPPVSSDGAGPNGSLVQGADGSLYGTTSMTVFRVTTSGVETTLYAFPSSTSVDYVGGATAGLILASDGNFYGTTRGTGIGNNIAGTVYQISPSGTESAIYTWQAPDSGDLPLIGGVIQGSSGLLYGTVYGSSVFSLETTGSGETEVPLSGYGCDGVQSSLVQAHDGNLYGISTCFGGTIAGSVFKAVPGSAAGAVTTIDMIGSIPAVGNAVATFPLIEGNDGNLYGTISTGGGACPQNQRCGNVFRITPSGAITVLYTFGTSPSDGQNPSGALVLASDGNFYGTTLAGGTPNANCKAANGCGTLYRITPSGTETVLYSFGINASDGIGPSGALVQASDGDLYGTTSAGGSTNSGTVFKLQMNAN